MLDIVLRSLLLLVVVSLAPAASGSLTLTPEHYGCVPDGVVLCSAAIRKAVAHCETVGACTLTFQSGTYLTQAFNLTSNMEIRIGANATILGTSEDRYNLAAHGGDWPVLPWPEYPSLPTRSPQAAAQAVIRGCESRNWRSRAIFCNDYKHPLQS